MQIIDEITGYFISFEKKIWSGTENWGKLWRKL